MFSESREGKKSAPTMITPGRVNQSTPKYQTSADGENGQGKEPAGT